MATLVLVPDSIAFVTREHDVAVRIEPAARAALYRFAAERFPYETGGALVGFYDDDHRTAVVTEALGPPPDTVHGLNDLTLGIEGVGEYLEAIWPTRYYLGDWHTHPGEIPPFPSALDHEAMRAISTSPNSRCPQPISIIVGGVPGAYAFSVTLYEHKGKSIRRMSLDPR